jgi:hypothetical protein
MTSAENRGPSRKVSLDGQRRLAPSVGSHGFPECLEVGTGAPAGEGSGVVDVAEVRVASNVRRDPG